MSLKKKLCYRRELMFYYVLFVIFFFYWIRLISASMHIHDDKDISDRLEFVFVLNENRHSSEHF